jgi:hypothetical protein
MICLKTLLRICEKKFNPKKFKNKKFFGYPKVCFWDIIVSPNIGIL